MKTYLNGFLLLLAFFTLIVIGCPENSGGSGGGSSGSASTDLSSTDTGTGTVTGTVSDDATVTIEQSDGSTQATTTSEEDPEFIFEDVPEGEATLTIETEDGQTTTQTIQVNDGETTQVNPFGSTQEMDNSLLAKVYEMPTNSSSVSNMTDTQLGDDFYAKEINVPERKFSEGFPGITDRYEWFGIVYEGQITAPVDGTYKFIIECDDGAVLWINGIKVVNGDGVHPTTSYQGTIYLTAGETYSFLLKYFQGPRYHITLVLKNQIPGEETKLFNSDDYAE